MLHVKCSTALVLVVYSFEGISKLHLILYGLSGSGVSSTGNSIIGQAEFEAKHSFDSVTKECKIFRGFRFGRRIEVIDTPGFQNDLERNAIKEMLSIFKQVLNMASYGPTVLLFVSPIDRFTEENKMMVRCLKQLPDIQKYIIVIFTGSDRLEESLSETKQKIKSSFLLEDLMELSSRRFVLFNNTTNDENQVHELFRYIDELIKNKSTVSAKRRFEITVEAQMTAAVYNAEKLWMLFAIWIFIAEWFYTPAKRIYESHCTIL